MAGVNGKGTRLYVSDNGEFTGVKHLAHLTEVGEIGGTTSEIDVTDLDSEGKEYVAGDTDYGSVSISGNLVGSDEGDTAYKRLNALFKNKKVVNWGICHPVIEDANVGFKGYVSSLKIGARNTDNLMTFNAEIRISGALGDFTEPVGALKVEYTEDEL